MRFSLLAIGFLACAAPLWAQNAPRRVAKPVAPSLLALQNEAERVVARAAPAVVTILCQKPRSEADSRDKKAPAADPFLPISTYGAGWVFRADGLILTNYHVVRNATSVHVSFGANSEDLEHGVGIPARVVGYDPDSDLAVLKIQRTGLPTLEWADSGAVRIGQWVVAIGAPFSRSKSVSVGVLSGRGRVIKLDESSSPSPHLYLQTDAALNPGNSGGPLLDLAGRVVGLNSAVESSTGAHGSIGFSLPSNTIRRLLPRLLAGTRVKRAFFGAASVIVAPDVARELGIDGGLLIGALLQKDGADIGPAKVAGVRQGDILLRMDGKPVTTQQQLVDLLSTKTPGDTVFLVIARPDFEGTGNTRRLTLSVVLGDSALALGDAAPAFTLAPDVPLSGSGFSVADAKTLDASYQNRYAIKGTESGAVVYDVVPLSPADEAGLVGGCRIVRVRQGGKWTDITSAADWKALESKAAPGAHLLLQISGSENGREFRVLVLPAKKG